MKQQAGFTLIELVVVIMILGILAATAVPKFIDLSNEAETASLDATIGALASASMVNYAACAVNNYKTGSGSSCTAITTCTEAAGLIKPAPSSDESKFAITTKLIPENIKKGETFTCTLSSKRAESSVSKDATVTYVNATAP